MTTLGKLRTAAALLVSACAASAQVCEPEWLPGAGYNGCANLSNGGQVTRIVAFDPDSDGPMPPNIIVGGSFSIAGTQPANNVAAWDGVRWTAMGAGLAYGVSAMAVYDADGNGGQSPMLVAAGGSTFGGFQGVCARWDGSAWLPIISSYDNTILDFAVFDADGDGPQLPRLIACGAFASIDGQATPGVAQWDGTSWSPMGTLSTKVLKLAVLDSDGACPQPPRLFAAIGNSGGGGVGGVEIMQWNGADWVAFPSLVSGGDLKGVTTFDPDGAGPLPRVLVAYGPFSQIESLVTPGIAWWDGSAWQPFGTGFVPCTSRSVETVAEFDPDGNGPLAPYLYAWASCGLFDNKFERWNGSSWSTVTFNGGTIRAMLSSGPLRPGDPPARLFVGGGALAATGTFGGRSATETSIMIHDGQNWDNLGLGNKGVIYRLITHDFDGSGSQPPQLVAGSIDTVFENQNIDCLAKWDGTAWSGLGASPGPLGSGVHALASFDADGPGGGGAATLIAAGRPYLSSLETVLSWNGASWQSFGQTFSNGTINVLTSWDSDGPGPGLPQLYAGGLVSSTTGILRWNGTSWVNYASLSASTQVKAMVAWDPNSTVPQNAQLVAGGNFTSIGGVAISSLASRSGSSWSALGSGVNGAVTALCAYDSDGPSGSPARLIVAGPFTTAGGAPAAGIARWNGTAWSALGTGLTLISGGLVSTYAMAEWDPDGSGPATPWLVVTGNFDVAGGVPAGDIAAWDGAAWRALGAGLLKSGVSIRDLCSFDPDGPGPALPQLCATGTAVLPDGSISAVFSHFGSAAATWRTPVSGDYDQSLSWLCANKPSSFDRIQIDAGAAGYAPGAFTIRLSPVGGTVTAASFSQSTDDVTMNLRQRSLLLTAAPNLDHPGLLVGDRPEAPAVLRFSTSVPDTGTIEASIAVLGAAATVTPQSNALIVAGAGNTLWLDGDAYVARRANRADLSIRQGGLARVFGNTSIATETGAVGELSVLGTGSALFFNGYPTTLQIGQGGDGTLRVGGQGPGEPGALTSTTGAPLAAVTMGTLAGSRGTAVVSGPGSICQLSSDQFSVGYSGSGTLRVEAGASLETTTSDKTGVWIARNSGSTGLAVITGSQSTWVETTARLKIGAGGTLQLNNGGVLTVNGMEIRPGGVLAGDSAVAFSSPTGAVVNLGTVSPSSGAEDASGVGTLSILGDLVMCDVVCSPPGACCTISGCADTTGQACFDVGGVFHPGESCSNCPCGSDGLTHPQTGSLLIDLASASSRDQLTVSQGATLAGSLVVSNLNPAYVPSVGDTLPFLSAGSMTGAFGVALMPALPGGRFLIPTYNYEARSPGVSLYCASLSNDIDLGQSASTPVAGVPAGAALADFDGDGDLDLAVSIPDPTNPVTSPGSVVILRNAGNTGSGGSWAGFTQAPSVTITVGVDPRGIAAGRFNADNAVDLAVTNFADGTVKVLSNLNDGTGQLSVTQTIAVGAGPVAVAAADLRNLGKADLAVANKLSNSVSVLNNNGAGAFALNATLGAGAAPVDIKAARLDADALPDLITANSGDGTVGTYAQTPSGFALSTPHFYFAGEEPSSIEPGQIDNGKDMDVVVTNTGGGSMTFLMGDGAGGFQPGAQVPAGTAPTSVALADLDGDGDRDLAVVTLDTSSQSVIRVFRNDLTGDQLSFTDIGDQFAGADPRLVRAGDVDANGRADLVAVNAEVVAARGTVALDRGGAPGRGAKPTRGVQPNIIAALSRPPCPADLSGDRAVGTADLVLLLAHFGQSVIPGTGGDLNNDGVVNTNDLVLLLVAFGHACG